jgi:hypothetical protein
MKTLFFTICARNYIGLANVLGDSVKLHHDAVDYKIYVADGFDETISSGLSKTLLSGPVVLQPYFAHKEYVNMAFMYNITEFCTSIKAACFKHAFDQGYDRCVYLDPDVLVFSKFDEILGCLESHSIVVTPHLCLPSNLEGPRSDSGILATGIYNLGFLGLTSSVVTADFLDWWHERLRWQAFNDHSNSLYTDQRWIDFVPSLFPGSDIEVLRHLGCNLAPWNFHERQVNDQGGSLVVSPRARQKSSNLVHEQRLLFAHFSGFDFKQIIHGKFDQINLPEAKSHPDMTAVYNKYASAIKERGVDIEHFLAQPYSFDYFENGQQVQPVHRRLLREWRKRHGNIGNPFAVEVGSFYSALKKRRLISRTSQGEISLQKAPLRQMPNVQKIERVLPIVFGALFRIIGARWFFLLVRSFNRLSTVEYHYDMFDFERVVSSDSQSG